MSHFLTLVIGNEPEKQLAKYDENIEIHEDGSVWRTYNNDAKWDWYQMGGRYA